MDRRRCLMGAAASVAALSGRKGETAAMPRVVIVTGDHEYGGEQTLPLLAGELKQRYGWDPQILKAHPDQNAEENIPGLDALRSADLAVFFLRWRRLPPEQVAPIDAYLKSGKPVVGFRTTSHAFNYPAGHPLADWNAFGERAFGTPPGWGRGHTHYGHNSSTDVRIEASQAGNPVLKGVAQSFHYRSWLYHVLPNSPPADAQRLLIGTAVDPDKAAIENPVAWTWRNKHGGRAFYTSLGHPEDFALEPFQRLVVNALHWAADRPIPSEWAGPMSIRVPYQGIRKSG